MMLHRNNVPPKLPDIVLIEILSYLDTHNLVRSALSHKRLYNLILNQRFLLNAALWQKLCQRFFPEANIQGNFRTEFLSCYRQGLAIGARILCRLFARRHEYVRMNVPGENWANMLAEFRHWHATHCGVGNPYQLVAFSEARLAWAVIPFAAYEVQFQSLPSAYQMNQFTALNWVLRRPEVMRELPDALYNDRAFTLQAVKIRGDLIAQVAEQFKQDKEIVLASLQAGYGSLSSVTPVMRADPDIVAAGVKRSVDALRLVPESLLADHRFLLRLINIDLRSIEWFSPKCFLHKAVMTSLFEHSGLCFLENLNRCFRRVFHAFNLIDYLQSCEDNHVLPEDAFNASHVRSTAADAEPATEMHERKFHQYLAALQYVTTFVQELRSDNAKVLAAVSTVGASLQYATKDQQANREIVLAAVRQDGLALQYAASHLKHDESVVWAAVRANGKAYQYCGEAFQNDDKFILASLNNNDRLYERVNEERKRDRSYSLAAVKQNGVVFRYLTEEFKADREIAFEAVKHYSFAYFESPRALQREKAFLLAALKKNSGAISEAPEELKSDKAIAMMVLQRHGHNIEYVAEKFKFHKKFVRLALANYATIAQFPPEMVMNREVYFTYLKCHFPYGELLDAYLSMEADFYPNTLSDLPVPSTIKL